MIKKVDVGGGGGRRKRMGLRGGGYPLNFLKVFF